MECGHADNPTMTTRECGHANNPTMTTMECGHADNPTMTTRECGHADNRQRLQWNVGTQITDKDYNEMWARR